MEYDVIIAGAGPAGAQCARYLGRTSNLRVLLLDKTLEIGEPKKSTAGTPMKTMKAFDLPKKVTMRKFKSIIFESPAEEAELPIDGYVLDFGKLKKYLVEDAVHNGVDVKIGATVTKPIFENKKVTGVEYSDFNGKNAVKAKIVIDATGPLGILATKVGIRKLNPKYYGIGMEFQMERLKLKHQNSLTFRYDNTYAPGGYSWIFPTAKNHAKVGLCWGVKIFTKKKGKGSLTSYLMKFIKGDERLKSGIPMEIHAGDVYFSSPNNKKSTHNFMGIGDAICTIHPLFAEGIRFGMHSANLAAQVAIDSIKEQNTSAKQLVHYDKLWKENIGKHRVTFLYLANKLYNFSNNNYDKFVKNLRKLDKPTIERLTDYRLTLNDIRKLTP